MINNVRLCAFADEADIHLTEQIKALKENNIELLEIRGVDGENIANITLQKAREIKRMLDDNGIHVWSLGSPAGKTDINKNFSFEREQFLHLMEIGNILDADCIRLFSFYGTQGKDEYRDEVMFRLSEFAAMAKDANIVPCHENEKGIYGEKHDKCLEIHKALPEIRCVFDPANYIQSNVYTLEAWNMLKDYVYYGHIKDATGDGCIVPPGSGVGHLSEYLSEFFAMGKSVLTLEPHLFNFVGLANLEQDNQKSNVGHLKFKNNREAFDCAVNALKSILENL